MASERISGLTNVEKKKKDSILKIFLNFSSNCPLQNFVRIYWSFTSALTLKQEFLVLCLLSPNSQSITQPMPCIPELPTLETLGAI
jgi:hypothetical protein